MKTSIHYLVEATYWRREVPNIHDDHSVGAPTFADVANTQKTFKNASPLLAREAAFNHYFSILDVLYDGLEKEQTTDAQARIDLQKYLDSGNAIELGNSTKFKTSPDFDKGIEIYMVIENLEKNTKEQFSIHGVRYLDYLDRFDAGISDCLQGLLKEYHYYQQHGIEVKQYTEDLNLEEVGGEKEKIIKTPFDWQKLILDYKGYDLCDFRC